MTEIREFEREHLEGALALFTAAGWETYFEDPARTERALCSPGSTTLVAVDDGAVAAHLSALLVGESWRGRGISRDLLREGLQRAEGMRMDIISAAESFYSHLGAESKIGFRLRPADLRD